MKKAVLNKINILFIMSILWVGTGASAYHTDAFLTNNSVNYNADTNLVQGDNWSYLRYNGKISNGWNPTQMLMASKNKTTIDSKWYFANDKLGDWYIEPGGKMKTDAGRIMIFNFTIGEKTAGRDLKVSGSLTGAATTDLYIFKTEDEIESTADFGKGAIVLAEGFHTSPLAYFENLPENGESFELVIPASEAVLGNDIMFWSEVESGSYIVNTLDVSIEEIKFLTADKLAFTDTAGNEIIKLTGETNGFSVNTIVSNHLYEEVSASLVTVLYDGDTNKIKSIKSTDKTLDHKENEGLGVDYSKEELEALHTKNADYFKIYLWNGFEAMEPLALVSEFPERISPYAKNILDFVGVNGNQADMSVIGDIRWCRTDFAWQSVEPAKGQINNAQLEAWGVRILKQKENGITMLPILDYCADWAADPAAYSYVWAGTTYSYSEAVPVEGSTSTWKRVRTVTKADGTSTSEEISTRRSRERFLDVQDWKDYVELIVSTYSKPPYNLEYFQIWNEAHPASSFYNGGMDYYMQSVHKTAAEIIRRYGCKVVYGGWPSVGGHGNYFNYLDAYDAWDTIDVFSMHYYSLDAMNQLYNRALKSGVKSPCVWQTEVGWEYNNTGFVSAQYPRMFYWALERRSDQKDQFKPIFFSWASPNSPDAYGYNKNLMYTDGTITKHGYNMKNLLNLLKGTTVERYTAITTEAPLGNGVTGNTLLGFEVDSKKVVLSAAIAPIKDTNGVVITAAADLIANFPISLSGVYGVKSVKLISDTGLVTTPLTYSADSAGNVTFSIPKGAIVPTQKGIGEEYVESVYLYVLVEAEQVAAPRNNVKDFELGSRKADNKVIIDAGRWSYLDGHYNPPRPLTKGTAQNNLFGNNEWVVDNAKSSKAWCLSQSGTVYTDTRPMIYNYTIDKDMAGKDLVISGRFTPNSKNRNFRISKTTDNDEFSPGSYSEEIYVYNGRAVQDFRMEIPAAAVSYGNDILFALSSVADRDYGTAMTLEVTISVKNE